MRKFAKPLGLRAVAVYGGPNISEHIAKLKAGAHIIVATPGRMIDLLTVNNGRTTNLTRVSYLVMDEADRMFDMGFGDQVLRIIAGTRPDRQTLLFSATFPRVVEAAARKVLTQPVEVVIGGRSVASSDVTQIIHILTEEQKFAKLTEILAQWYETGNIIIFVDKQESVELMFRHLAMAGYPALAVHGGMDQIDRNAMIADFKNKIRTLMVATSILARGLDVKDLVLVINYDIPTHYEDYVHRIGRTGRAGAHGTAITFLTPDQDAHAPDLVKGLEKAGQEVPAPLAALLENFKAKVSRNEARYRSATLGYKTSGFKYDEEEAAARADSQLLQRAARAEANNMMTDEITEALERKRERDEAKRAAALAANVGAKAAGAGAGAGPGAAGGATALSRAGSVLANSSAAGGAAAAAGTPAAGAVLSAEDEAASRLEAALAMMAQVERTVGAAAGAAASAAGAAGAGAGAVTTAGASAGVARIATSVVERFSAELEVNDYPSQARWNVLKKPYLDMIREEFGVAVTSKGQYREPGAAGADGVRPLYVLIEGKSEEMVRRAKMEMLNTVERDAALVRPDVATATQGKYSI